MRAGTGRARARACTHMDDMSAGLTVEEVRRIAQEEFRRMGERVMGGAPAAAAAAAAAGAAGGGAALDGDEVLSNVIIQRFFFRVCRATRNSLLVDIYADFGGEALAPSKLDAMLDAVLDWTDKVRARQMRFLQDAFDEETASDAYGQAARAYLKILAYARPDCPKPRAGYKTHVRHRVQSLEEFFKTYLRILVKSSSLREDPRPFFKDTPHADACMRSAFLESLSRNVDIVRFEQVPLHDDTMSIAVPRDREREREREQEREREREREAASPTSPPPPPPPRVPEVRSAPETKEEDLTGPPVGADSQSHRVIEPRPEDARWDTRHAGASLRSQARLAEAAVDEPPRPRRIVSVTAADLTAPPAHHPPRAEESVRGSLRGSARTAEFL